MKKKMGVFIFVFLAVMVMGGIQPALLYSSETPWGNVWDILIDTGSFTGTKWFGPLSVYYDYTGINCGDVNSPPTDDPEAILYFTVRLSKGGVPYAYYGVSSEAICLSQYDVQRDEIWLFLSDALKAIYKGDKQHDKDWKLKSLQNATYLKTDDGVAFVVDIQITVK